MAAHNEQEDEQEQDKGFRVVDRRHFTAEGQARPETPPESAQPPPPTNPDRSPIAPNRAAEPQPAPAAKSRPARDNNRSRESAGPTASHRIDFLSFVASLATNALAALGLLPEAQAQGLPRNPELAREYIDILAMLQEKTRGNLSAQEDAAMGQILADLRLQFVEATRRR